MLLLLYAWNWPNDIETCLTCFPMPIAIIPWIIYQLYGNHPKPWSRRKRPPLCALQSGSWAGPEQPGSVGSVSGHQGGYQPAGPPQNIGIIDTCAAEQKVWSGMSVQPISSKKTAGNFGFWVKILAEPPMLPCISSMKDFTSWTFQTLT